MNDTKGSVDCVTREMNSGGKIASLKEKLAKDHSSLKINGTNGNGSHKSDEINSKDHKLGKVINGVNSKTDNGVELKTSERYTNSSLKMTHMNGNSNTSSVKNTSNLVENNTRTQITERMSVKSTDMCYEEDEESIDDEEIEDSSPGGYGDDDSSDVVQLDPSTSNSPTPGTSGSAVKKQLPMNSGFKRNNEMSENEDEVEDIEEVKDSDSDSDIMEVDADDIVDTPTASKLNNKDDKPKATPNNVTGKTNIVTIDDMKTLKALADSAKLSKQMHNDKTSASIAEANRLISGRKSGGVTITPAVRNLPPGLTISQSKSGSSQSSTSNGGKLSLPAGISVSPASQASTNITSVPPNKVTEQLDDPNLTDDTFVVEAPSFIVPYVYEKPPKESIKEFKVSIRKLEEEIKKEKDDDTDKDSEDKSESPKKDKSSTASDNDIKDKSSENSDKTDDNSKKDSPEVTEVKSESTDISLKKSEFFDSCLGKLFYGLGMNLVQETVQKDLLAEQQRRARKDKSAAVMHAIMSLKANIEQSKDRNKAFEMELKKCKFCSFRTESQAVLDHHMETPHMKGSNYRCNVCKLEVKTAQEVTSHMLVEHGVRARLERAAAIHQCPQCPFEDNQKGKLTRHKVGCDKRFRPERIQEPPHDWEPPAKIPKPAVLPHQKYQQGRNILSNMQGLTAQQQLVQQMAARGHAGYSALQQQQLQMQLANAGMKQMPPLQQMGFRSKGQGSFKNNSQAMAQQMRQGGFPMGMKNGKPVYMQSSYAQNQALMQALNQGNNRQQAASQAASNMLPNLGNNSSVTIQSIGSRSTNKSSHSPSISITPLPGGRGQNSSSGKGQGHMQSMKPGQPGNNQGRGFVICEVCDGYIKDMEQLRNHMQWIHKVKIHPKMIHNRPPLNCQKCQYRFFTDQGLERHLLGTHGLVTASMQDLANKGQDSGRCPVCGKVYQWKLLNHVAKDHMKVLKPAHLSYKCTVCTATFGQYKLFENHVYTVHSGAKRGNNASGSSGNKPSGSSQTNPKQPIKVSDEITIIPQKKNTPVSSNASTKSGMSWTSSLVAAQADAAKRKSEAAKEDPDIIDLDDEEEIDDDEPQKAVQPSSEKKGIEISKVAPSKLVSDFNINSSLELKKVNKPSNGEPVEKKIKLSESMNESAEGVEQIEEIDDDED